MEFFMNKNLVPGGATLKSLSFDQSPGNPSGPIFLRMVLSVPATMQVVREDAPPDAMGYPPYQERTKLDPIEGVNAFATAVSEHEIQLEYRFDSGGKVPNHPEFIPFIETAKKK
jgi:hypothetical protein